WRRDLKSAGVPEFDSKGGKRDFYALRHTSVRMVRRGASLKAAQEHAGHSSAAMTLNAYDGVDASDIAKVVASLPVVPMSAALALQSPVKSGRSESVPVQVSKDQASGNLRGKAAENSAKGGEIQMGRAGIEPATHGFSVHCSTN